MKKYTLEQLKTEQIKIRVKTLEICTMLMQKFEKHNISWCGGQKATDYKVYGELVLVNLCDAEGQITFGQCADGYTTITPDQIDWGEDKQAEAGQVTINGGIMPPTDWKITTATLKQDNTPAVFTKAQKDWNAFKAFVKEIEMHGRGLTSSQLKTFMAKTRKDIEDK